ncbi:MAG: ECF transporter S component [Clostridia bacterium]|nr:ECF transporter S component [Clostridia bacterium]
MKHNTSHKQIKLICISAMFAALVFVATFLVKVPLPVGYVHIGDGIVFLASALLPMPYAMAAAGLGVGLADLCAGYAAYIPVTVLIRVLTVLCFSRKKQMLCLHNVIALAASIVLCAFGYWAFEAVFMYESGIAALAGLPFNIAQSALGAAIYFVVAKTAGKWLKKAVEK